MADRSSLEDRMKSYEKVWSYKLPPRMPVIIRVDGRAFHTLTRGLETPFDVNFIWLMDTVAVALCEQIQGAQLAYVQSDEISVLVHNYKRFESQGWFDNQVQKMVSISAAIASAVFTAGSDRGPWDEPRIAQFDSRVFVLPEAEVCNYFIWRQRDFERNSVQMLARSLFSHKECDRKNNADLQEMCWQKGKNWNNLETRLKRGRCIVRSSAADRRNWICDTEIPQFKLDRNYIEQHLALETEMEEE